MCEILISKVLSLARVYKGSHSFTCHPHISWHRAILPLLSSPRASPHFGRYLFPIPCMV